MCYHRRIVYDTCRHHVWGGIAKPCEEEKRFKAGEVGEGCSKMLPHTLCTTVIEQLCNNCVKRNEGIDRKFDTVKGIISKLRANLVKRVGEGEPISEFDMPEPEKLVTPDVPSNLEDTNGEDSDDYENMSEVDLEEFENIKRLFDAELKNGRVLQAPSSTSGELSSSESDVRPPKGKAAEKPKVLQVNPDPNHRPLYLPVLMGWGLWSSPPLTSGNGNPTAATRPDTTSNASSTSTLPPLDPLEPAFSSAPTKKKKEISWNESLNRENWDYYKTPRGYLAPGLAVGFAFGFWVFWRSYLRRLNGAGYITPGYFRKRSLFGKVTSVGDGDGFHLFHTPGGRLAGWGWLRRVPKDRKELKGRTISIRLAGVDAPEGAHFGRPAQPFSAEALVFLQNYILGKRVRAYIYKRDQYERIVATVFVRKPPFFLRKDVGKELLNRGLATIYESKTGAEFGGPAMEQSYKTAEAIAKRKRKGMWGVEKAGFFGFGKKEALETPRAYKERIKKMENDAVKTMPVKTAPVKKK
ncbi:hypothetical protein B0T14DRAFT_417563 [Immersiella caudata]|uniref:Probable endonuclease LCL3 n=1 Tax=Immersiella caudata TaxID=314043 RepID=A0AA40CBR0_9PEZI|nr:hypothetical protein B0T14DRAFT_417563 [Immersiella caudata]